MLNARKYVAVGVVFNEAKDKVLIAKRLQNAHQGGLWEFPGGKIQQNEGVEQALRRELFEELGLIVEKAGPFICIEHDYPDKKVHLDVWKIEQWHGKVTGREGQEIEWVDLSDLDKREFPAANRSIIMKLNVSTL